MRGVRAGPESAFRKPSLLQSSELPCQIKPPDAVQPLTLSRPSLPSVRTNVDPHAGVFVGVMPTLPTLRTDMFCSGPGTAVSPSQGPLTGVPM